jgi:regulator of RNase E activity RraA
MPELDLEALRRLTTPTVANAVEALTGRPRDVGFAGPALRCLFPDLGAVCGHACTATIMSGQPPAPRRLVSRRAYWEHLREAPGPKVLVMQDLTDPPLGCYFGEVNANIHRALGVQGVITNGLVRDLDEVRALGFHAFAAGVNASHAHAHLEDFCRPVRVAGLTVNPGDLVHADRHGVVVIPREVAPQVPAAAREIEAHERAIIGLCRSPEFSLERLDPMVSKDY